MAERSGTFMALGIFLFLTIAGMGRAVAQDVDIQTFVRQTFIHGMPYEEVIRFDATHVPILLSMLEDPAEEAHWANIAVALGAIGDDRAVDALIALFVRSEAGALSPSRYAAKSSVLISLGYLVNKSGNLRALTYLLDSVRPGIWVERALSWESPYYTSPLALNRQLTALAVMGLALSGHPLAGTALASLDLSVGGAPDSALVAEAIRAHGIVSQEGLVAYYRQSESALEQE